MSVPRSAATGRSGVRAHREDLAVVRVHRDERSREAEGGELRLAGRLEVGVDRQHQVVARAQARSRWSACRSAGPRRRPGPGQPVHAAQDVVVRSARRRPCRSRHRARGPDSGSPRAPPALTSRTCPTGARAASVPCRYGGRTHGRRSLRGSGPGSRAGSRSARAGRPASGSPGSRAAPSSARGCPRGSSVTLEPRRPRQPAQNLAAAPRALRQLLGPHLERLGGPAGDQELAVAVADLAARRLHRDLAAPGCPGPRPGTGHPTGPAGTRGGRRSPRT